ncbi:hypothetical protein [Phaffia rhodozyma]|uniref:Uncharacterized protein n=1 Tax=Phaffia rhodozyma TaxID=264483 RepID=A0A0F7SQV6_PHARH|nr:hypothetical protein [Phaffia rhodozyma]
MSLMSISRPPSDETVASKPQHEESKDGDSDGDEDEDEDEEPFVRDQEGESMLKAMLDHILTSFGSSHADQNPVSEKTKGKRKRAESKDDNSNEVYDFRLTASEVKPIALRPPEIHFKVPNPHDKPLTEQDLALLKSRASSAAVSSEWVLSQATLAPFVPSRPIPTYYIPNSPSTGTAPPPPSTSSSSSSTPTLLLTTTPRPGTNPRTRHFPPPDLPERGPGGHLPCAQYQAVPLNSLNSEAPLKKRRKQRKRLPAGVKSEASIRPSNPQQERPQPMFFCPSEDLGGKCRGYAYGYNINWDLELDQEGRGYQRDKLKIGWVEPDTGASWWGRKGDAGGRKRLREK